MKESGKLAIMAGVSALALLLMRGKKTTTSKPRIHPKKRTYDTDDVEDDPEQAEAVGAVKSKAPKFYVYAGYYELFISSQPMPAPYVLLKTFRKIDRAIEYTESFDDNVVYCENVKDYLPTFLYEVLQDSDYEYFVY